MLFRPLFVSVWCVLPALILMGCKETPPTVRAQAPIVVSTLTVQSQDETLWLDALGRVESGNPTEVRSQVSGRLKRIHYEAGKPVFPNTVLYTLDEDTYKAKVQDTEAALAAAKTTREKAQRDWQRNQQLFKQNVVSRVVYDDAKTAYQNALNNETAAKAKWQQAIIDLNHCTIRATKAGVAQLSLVNPGDMITAQSTLMTTIETPQDLRVSFTLSDRQLANKTPTLDSAVLLSLENGDKLSGNLDYLSPALNTDTATRTFRVKLSDESVHRVLPGSFVKVRLAAGVLPNAFRVPQKAVLQLPDGSYQVFLMKDNKAQAQRVVASQWVDTDWVITSGLHSGDVVITNQLIRLRDGLKVELKSTKSKAATPHTNGSNENVSPATTNKASS